MTLRALVVSALAVVVTVTSLASQTAPPPPLPPQQPPAQPPITFRAEVNYVEVDARVLDQQGGFVSDLSKEAFQVLEDGKPQQVTIFQLVNIPVTRRERPLFASKPIEPDTQTNVGTFDGRVYLLVLDDLHVHPLRSTRVKAAARQFIERYLGANDMAAVIHTSGRSDAGQEFTSNPRLLLSAVDKFMGRKVRSSTLEKIDQESMTRSTRQQGDKIDDPLDPERGFQARNTLDTLKQLSDFLANVRGRRKALVFFSEGIDYDINDPFNNRDATTILNYTKDTIAAATRANVSIYGIDPRGLTVDGDLGIEVGSYPDDTSLGINSSSLQNELRLGQDSLRVLADETGGFASVNSNDFSTAFQRVVSDNSSYYVLGYYPTNDKRDGRFRKIEVRIANRPGLTVRARKGYAAPRGSNKAEKTTNAPNQASPELREAMGSPLPVSDLPMAATAAAFKGPAPNAAVVVSTLVNGDLQLTEKDGTFHNDLEIAVTAINQSGKVFNGERNTVSLNLKPDTVPRLRAAGFRVISQIDVPPGRYQLRVVAREANGKRAGSVLYDLEVPNFSDDKLTMSGIALTSASSGVAPTVRPKDPLAKLLPGPLSSYREFGQQDELALFVEVYDNQGGAAHKVDIGATLKAEGGQTVFQTREERDSSELGSNTGGGYGFSARVPLKDVAPGMYVLRVEAQSRIGDRPQVARESVVRIVAQPPTK
jgi:VWFA-related protein